MIMKSDNQAVLPPYWFIEDGFPSSPAQIPLLLLALTKNPRGLSAYPSSQSNLSGPILLTVTKEMVYYPSAQQ